MNTYLSVLINHHARKQSTTRRDTHHTPHAQIQSPHLARPLSIGNIFPNDGLEPLVRLLRRVERRPNRNGASPQNATQQQNADSNYCMHVRMPGAFCCRASSSTCFDCTRGLGPQMDGVARSNTLQTMLKNICRASGTAKATEQQNTNVVPHLYFTSWALCWHSDIHHVSLETRTTQ